MSPEGLKKLGNLLFLHEGFKSHVYLCPAGKKTIGIGRNIEDNPLTEAEKEHLGNKDINLGITLEEAKWLLDESIQDLIRQLSERISSFESLDEVRQAVLVDMAYNMGVAGLMLFHVTLWSISHGDYVRASQAMMDSLWSNQVRERASRLSRMMKSGEWPKGV